MNESHLPAFLVSFGLFGIILAIVTTLFWIWMLIDCLTNTRLDGVNKIIWLLVIFFLHVLGAIVYFFVGRSGRNKVAI